MRSDRGHRSDEGRRRLPWSLFALATAGLAGLLMLGAPVASSRPVPIAELATAQLSDDALGRPMFAVADIVPDVPVSRCLRVSYTATATTGSVFIDAVGITGDLAPYLSVRVDQGAGGRFGDCAGFAGTQIFQGSLPDLANAGAGPVPTGWSPQPGTDRTFRIAVTLRDGAPQATTASATFRWLLMDTGVSPLPAAPTPPAPASPAPRMPSTPPPPADPSATTASGVPSVPATAAGPGATPTSGTRAPSSSEPPAATASGSGSNGAGGPMSSLLHKLGEAAGTLARSTMVAGRFVAVHGKYPAIPAAMLAAFLAVQNWIDRRDPKLASAPLWRDEYLYYDTPPDGRP